jgi:hypothetical protein
MSLSSVLWFLCQAMWMMVWVFVATVAAGIIGRALVFPRNAAAPKVAGGADNSGKKSRNTAQV